MKIWMYWEGADQHPYYSLCQETVKRHNANVQILGPDDLPDLIGEVPEMVDKSYVVHKVDWIRKQLLFKQGGLYVDSDFICTRSLEPLRIAGEQLDFLGYKEWSGGWMDNVVACKKGSKVMEAAADYAQRIIEIKKGRPNWLEPNRDAIDHALGKYEWVNDFLQIPTHLIEPHNVCDPGWFLQEVDSPPEHHSFGYITSFHELRTRLEGMSREQLLNGKHRVCHLFRQALGL